MRRIVFAWFAPLVLIAHTLITACVPAPLLLLSRHEHLFIGQITSEAWVAHTQWHLKHMHGHFEQAAPDVSATPTTGKVISANGCDLQALQAYYGAMHGALQRVYVGADLGTNKRNELPAPRLQAPNLAVPHPPPRPHL